MFAPMTTNPSRQYRLGAWVLGTPLPQKEPPVLVRSIRAGHTVTRPGRKYTRRLNRQARALGYHTHGAMVESIMARMRLAQHGIRF